MSVGGKVGGKDKVSATISVDFGDITHTIRTCIKFLATHNIK